MRTKKVKSKEAKTKGLARAYAFYVVAQLLLCAFCFSPFILSARAQSVDDGDTIRIDSDLVNLNVGVFGRNARVPVGELQPKDFLVYEDGVPQTLSHFAAANAPFDLVLLLDLSGSVSDKLKLVRRSAVRFVEAARPVDRVGVVTFTSVPRLVAPLTYDRAMLKASIEKIPKPAGGTRFWDALRYLIETPRGTVRAARRRTAIVVMTDGVDNALPGTYGTGSQTSFDELLELVKQSESIIIPIYLDTEREVVRQHQAEPSTYFFARQQLQQLAVESGSQMYQARKLEDLTGVYEQVIRDLGTVYSLGYRPTNHARNNAYRSVNVRLVNHPNLITRTRRGYYAKQPTATDTVNHSK